MFIDTIYKPFAEFLEWRPNDASFANHTLAAYSDICKVTTEDTIWLNDGLKL